MITIGNKGKNFKTKDKYMTSKHVRSAQQEVRKNCISTKFYMLLSENTWSMLPGPIKTSTTPEASIMSCTIKTISELCNRKKMSKEMSQFPTKHA